MKKTVCILLITFSCLTIFPQQAANWKNYTSMTFVNDVAALENTILGATTGGAFLYDFSANSFNTLRKADGLTGTLLSAAAIDKYGKVWIGGLNGTIDIYNPAENSFKAILDISISNKSSKVINEINITGDTAIVSTDFGISLININDYSFISTTTKFGELSSNIRVNSTFKTDVIYVCTDFGLAIQKQGATNLVDPNSWEIFTSANGLPSEKVFNAHLFNNNMLVSTDNGIFIQNGTSWTSYIPEISGSVIDLTSGGGNLYILKEKEVFSYNGSISSIYQSDSTLNAIVYSSGLGLLAASNKGIIKINNGSSPVVYLPNGPAANLFPSLSVDNNGTLWSASGSDNTGGFYKYENGAWINYTYQTHPEIISNTYFSIYSAPDNTKYVGSWGSGFVRYKEDIITAFNASNTDIKGIVNDPSYLVITDFKADDKNNLWILNYESIERSTLSMLTADSVWYHYTIPSENGLTLHSHFELGIDQYGTKWFASRDGTRSGVYYFNERGTYDNKSDDLSGFINSNSGLNDNTVNDLAVDRRGDIWVGTPSGMNVIGNTGTVTSQGSAQFRITSVFALRQLAINCIAVDPLNQKWVGTNQGLLLVNSDGSSLLASYDSKNSALLNDAIRSIAIDENSGTIYVGTDAGLTSFETLFIKPADSFSELFIYPSPFIIKNSENRLTIDGLIRDTDIKILNSNGRLVNEFTSPGGRMSYWNGRDNEGNLVGSGVYFIVAYDKEGNNVTTGKIAVLRE